MFDAAVYDPLVYETDAPASGGPDFIEWTDEMWLQPALGSQALDLPAFASAVWAHPQFAAETLRPDI